MFCFFKNSVQNRYIPIGATLKDTHYEEEEDSPSSTSALLGTSSPRRPTSNNNNNNNNSKRFLLFFFMWPFNLVWRLTWNMAHFIGRLLYRPAITAPRRHDARSEADRFLRDFEFTYGTTHPSFFSEGGYTQALKTAKDELKYMLVILISEEHDDNDAFCRETLTNTELIEFFHQHDMIVWGGNVRYTEAFQVSHTLQATTYPFMAIIALQTPNSNSSSSTNKMAVVERIEGPVTVPSLLRRLEAVLSRVDDGLSRVRREREEREAERRLRQEQDEAYRESLRADQLKQQRLEEQRTAEERAREARRLLVRHRKQYGRYLCQHVFKKDVSEDEDETTKISFRLANGARVIRKFRGDDTLETLYQFIEAYPYLQHHQEDDEEEECEVPEGYVHEYKFTIHSPFPRKEYEADATVKIKDEKGLWPSATLIVDTIEEEEEDL
ncbi:MAG: hypothetical protein EXX96DRAFT_563076 [Benjaminiella poitrasii]|nr:MAG: hypothetical protein EXX96DRAFT_563076 [Benjaminiella poitrasii]